MGKNKKTRWRAFSFNGSKEDDIHSSNGKLNDTEIQYNPTETQHKYSQVLGDHHSNYLSQISYKSSSIHNNKTRHSYNNKENYYNQRSAAKNTLSSKLAFQRKYASNSSLSLKDNKKFDSENGTTEEDKCGSTIKNEPIKFNEDEYTRITTPRQDVLFKKGYLSKMNSNNNSNNNKTVSPPIISASDSTAPNSTVTTTNSDPESSVSVSTLSPATTPSMDYGQQADGMEYTTPMYYPGYYYDENGLLVIPMYNGYNYYSNSSSSTSPVYLMPYPYHQFDPFFMAPNTEVPVPSEKSNNDQEDSNEFNEKSENEKSKSIDEEPIGAKLSSEDAITNHSEETESNEKDAKPEQNETASIEQLAKQPFTFYPNEYGYVYPTFSNGFYNGIYYYPNGMASNRPPKLKRRKRFLSTRNSHPSRSTETTTDYSDDDNGNSSYIYKRYNPRHHNGWMYHHNQYHYNQYHYNSKYNNQKIDKNANETSSNLNVDVPEFYPGVQTKSDNDEKESNTKEPDMPVKSYNDLQNTNGSKGKSETSLKSSKASHTSKTPNGRVSKKEIIEGIKLMEQQNINLISSSKSQLYNVKQDDDWNVIKNGKKTKILKDTDGKVEESTNANSEPLLIKTSTEITVFKEEIKVPSPEKIIISKKNTQQPQTQLKSTISNNVKSKKSKGKNKKKKNHLIGKQDGFEIIEPEFGNNSDDSNKKTDEIFTDDETAAESTTDISNKTVSNEMNIECGKSKEFVNTMNNAVNDECEQLNVVNADVLEPVNEITEEEIVLKVLNVQTLKKEDNLDDAIIDISDEDICNKSDIQIDLSIAQDIVNEIEKQIVSNLNQESIAMKEENVKMIENHQKEESLNEINFFEHHKNIAELERDLMQNLKVLDDGIDLKSPIINPLYDFPITSAVQKWLTEKQNESFESLFRIENFKRLSELYDDCENDDDDDDDDDDKSDISDSANKSETTDSDYSSDIQVKINGSPASSNAKIDKKLTSKCNNKIIVKESFCALM